MALFDFAKKKDAQVPMSTPTDYVRDMRAQGYSDEQIVQALRTSGYPEQMIDDAMRQTQVKTSPSMPAPSLMESAVPKGEPDKAEFESIAEAIVEERFQELKSMLDKRKEFEEKTNTELARLSQEVLDLKGDMQNLHKAIVSKISDYDKNLLSVGTEIKAMEKVFQNILPELTRNVSELSRITKSTKK